MFETLFKRPTVLARHRDGPLAQAREQFIVSFRQACVSRENRTPMM